MMKAIILVLGALLGACAPGGGIGLVAMMQDKQCQEWGFKPETPDYANCRMNLHQQSAASNAASQAYYQHQQELATERMNRQQTCTYSGINNGGIISGTSTCQ